MVALSGGLLPHYQQMYESAMDTAIKYTMFRPMVPDEADILMSGIVHAADEADIELEHQGQVSILSLYPEYVSNRDEH
jgi:mannosyl-oligosaccharide alpha-1,2-mannosidase